jgi:hypothetical protein
MHRVLIDMMRSSYMTVVVLILICRVLFRQYFHIVCFGCFSFSKYKFQGFGVLIGRCIGPLLVTRERGVDRAIMCTQED